METEFLTSNQERNKKKNGDIPNERIWSHKCSIHPVNMSRIMATQNNVCNYAHSIFFSDNREIKMKNPIYKRRKINKKKQSMFLKYISGNSEKILNKAYNKINFIKKETKELQKLNCLSLKKTSKLYFRTNRPKSIIVNNSSINRIQSASNNIQTQTINLNKNKKYKKNFSLNNSRNIITNSKFENTFSSNSKNELNILYTNENTNENTNPNLKKRNISNVLKKCKNNFFSIKKRNIPLKYNFNINSPINFFEDKSEEKFRNLINIDIDKLYSTNKKKHLNLARLNDVYHVQMNKSLHHYNAENHLKELNKIQRDNISVRQTMEDMKFKINQKINDRCQGQYYKKEYLKYKEDNEKEKKAKSLEKKSFPVQIPFNILFRDSNKKVKVFPHGYKIRAYYDYIASCERIQKSKNNDLNDFGADLLFSHLNNKDNELVYNTLDELFTTLEVDPIIKYIDKFKNEKAYKDNKVLKDRLSTYFPSLTETEKKIEKMEQHQIIKRKIISEEGNNLLGKILEAKKILNEKK